MSLPEDKSALKGRFKAWLADGWLPSGQDGGVFECRESGYHTTVIRVRKTGDFDYLYCQRQYHGTGIERGDKFEYAGIYCKRDGLIYDGQYDLRDLIADGVRSNEALRQELKQAVRTAVESAINNDRRNLRISDLSTEKARDNLAYFLKYSAADNARTAYLSGQNADGASYAFTFRCNYDPEHWTEDSLLVYILDPARYAAAEAAAYLDSHQEDMLSDFLRADMVAAQYSAILANTQNPIHCIKRIMRALNASSAKTVNVTIRKDDKVFTFKAEAAQFRRDCTSHYHYWSILAADRREYERQFKGSTYYGPEEILRIEYARTVLYQAETAE